MKLSKIQKFLKENSIEYNIDIDEYGFSTITIKDNRTKYKTISEISGIKGNTVKGMLVFFEDNGKRESIELTNQQEIINRLEKDFCLAPRKRF